MEDLIKEDLIVESEEMKICTDLGYIPMETLKNEKSTQDFIFKNGIFPIEKQAGQLIISEKITEIELCDQYKINVRLVELLEWKKIINKINRLPKKLKEEFKSCLLNTDKDQGITIAKIELIIDSIKKPIKLKKK